MIVASKSKHQDNNINCNTAKHNKKDCSFKRIFLTKSRDFKYSKFKNKADDKKDEPIPKNNESPVL